MCSPCLCTLSAIASIQPHIPTFGRFLLEIVLKFLLRGSAHALAVLRMHAPTNGVQQLIHCPHDRKALNLSFSYAQNKAQKHHPREFPGYWWLFQMQHLLRYSTRLVEERKIQF